jgi:hypothetical protein
MTWWCAFCGHDPYEYVNNGVGYERVAVTCCELGCAVYDHRKGDDAVIEITSKELREVAGKMANLQWQVERRNRTIEKLFDIRTRHQKATPTKSQIEEPANAGDEVGAAG